MATAYLSEVVARLGRPESADAELLARFADTRDESAFAELVRRHGGLVFGVCRRVTGNHHLAEDAFQAVFVVLAAKAAVVRPRGAVAAFLYGVAFRTALRARTTADRRRRREATVEALPEVGTEPPEACDAVEFLDEAIAALPEHLRLPVVLCELEGGSRADVARRLGIPEGTLSSRLASARKALARRLRNRGVVMPAGLVLAVPPGLCARAAAVLHPGRVPARVADLSSGVLRVMFLQKLKLVVAFAGFLVLAVYAGRSPAAPESPAPRAVPVATPKHQPKPVAGPNRLLVFTETKFGFFTPEGKELDGLPGHPDKRILTHPTLSPDGKLVAFLAHEDPPVDDQGNTRHHVFVRTADGQGDGKKVAVNASVLFWAADGKRLVACELVPAKELKATMFVTWAIDPKTGEKADLKLPRLFAASSPVPGGNVYAGARFDLSTGRVLLSTVTAEDGRWTDLTELRVEMPGAKVSPDGSKILFSDFDPDEKPAKGEHRLQRVFVFDVKTGKRARLVDVPLNAHVLGHCWSPDGKKVAYTWKQAKPGVPLAANTDNMNDPKINTETESFLVVADADGMNPKTVASRKAQSGPSITLGGLDWR